ncbi:MAG: type II toxin-antitoxin system Phd/YefM family antitoxin [Candidatus Sericytochromatia bacterium]
MSISSSQARDQFGEYFDRAAHSKERIAVTKRGKPRVAIVPIEDVRLLEFLENLLDFEAYRTALAEVEAGARPISLDESARSVGLDPDEMRRMAAERAAARQAQR